MKTSFLPISLFLLLFLLLIKGPALGQSAGISAANAHSHNDYLQSEPFHLAHQHQFGSLEADVFYRNDSLFVAHEQREITPERTFYNLYLRPIVALLATQNGIYPDKNRTLQLLIDLKTPYAPTLDKLAKELSIYQSLWYPRGSVRVVISGNTPPPAEFGNYPDFIYFDGRPETIYTKGQLERVALISQSFARYSKWRGVGQLTREDFNLLKKTVETAHKLGKPFRFWANPDTAYAWETLIDLQVDYINTDKIKELADYLTGR